MQLKHAGPLRSANRHLPGNRLLINFARRPAASLFLLSVMFLLPATMFAQEVTQNASSDGVDPAIKPGDDFYGYANNLWLGTVAKSSGQPGYDSRTQLKQKTAQRVQDLIEAAAAAGAPKGSTTQKVGDYYAAFMDMNAIETRKLTPLAGELAAIAAIASKASLSAYLGTTLGSEVDGLTTNADHIFGWWINQGFADSEHNVVHLWQGGLGLADRDEYLDPSPKMVELRIHYHAHIANVLKLAGFADTEVRATRILSLEIRIAQAFAPDADAADVFKQNNPWKRTDFDQKAPGMDWAAYFQSAGLARQRDFIVWQPSAVTGVSALVASESADVWKDYLRFHLIEHYAAVLPKAVRDEHFAFYSVIEAGTPQLPTRSQSAIAAVNGALGQAAGQLYTQRYFPPAAKVQAQAMLANLIAAYRTRITNLSWMSPETRQKALTKLAALQVELGYPDTWIDYSSLNIVRGDAYQKYAARRGLPAPAQLVQAAPAG